MCVWLVCHLCLEASHASPGSGAPAQLRSWAKGGATVCVPPMWSTAGYVGSDARPSHCCPACYQQPSRTPATLRHKCVVRAGLTSECARTGRVAGSVCQFFCQFLAVCLFATQVDPTYQPTNCTQACLFSVHDRHAQSRRWVHCGDTLARSGWCGAPRPPRNSHSEWAASLLLFCNVQCPPRSSHHHPPPIAHNPLPRFGTGG